MNFTSSSKTKRRSATWDEIREILRETTELVKRVDQQQEETARRMQETDRRMQETDRKFKELAARFTSTTGHIIEGLMEPAAMKLFQDKGFNVNRCWKNFKKHEKSSGRKLEVNLLLLDDDIAIVVEVKTNCTLRSIEHFVSQMAFFKEVCPEYSDKTILLAVAAINYDRDARQEALQQGLLVISVSDNDVFTLEYPDDSQLMKL